MAISTGPTRRRVPKLATLSLREQWSQAVIGQEQFIEAVEPYLARAAVGLAPEGRPAGIFLLGGPTGSGKTWAVKALAKVLHGTIKHLVQINCGEFQLDHEIAKITSSPPGYLGHRETPPLITQQKLAAVTSARSSLSIVLFDEVEKGSAGLQRLLLGILEEGTLRLGDCTVVNFEHTLIFMTTNLAADKIKAQALPPMGFAGGAERRIDPGVGRLTAAVMGQSRKEFAPEFMGRVDAVIGFRALTEEDARQIAGLELAALRQRVLDKIGLDLVYSELPDLVQRVVEKGWDPTNGARGIRRAVENEVATPLARRLGDEAVLVGNRASVRVAPEGVEFEFEMGAGG